MTCADCYYSIELDDGSTWCTIKRTEVYEICVQLQDDDDVLGQVFDG